MSASNVLITGASSGLGRGLALHYAREGATVHALARRRPELEALVAQSTAESVPGKIVPATVDVRDSQAQVAAIENARNASGGALDLVIANAGVGDSTPGSRLDWRAVDRVLDTNATAACVTVAAVVPAMLDRGEGTVAVMSSLAAFRGLPGAAAYCASKAALHIFMESVRVDLVGTGVKAVTLYPGFVKTEMTARNDFPMPFLMELDDAVRAIADGIARGSAVVAFPMTMRIFTEMLRYVPRAIYEPLARGRRTRSGAGRR